MATGLCSTCKVVLTEENSTASVISRGRGMCRLCSSKSSKRKYDKNPEKYRALSKQHRIDNPGEYKEYQDAYRKVYKLSLKSRYRYLEASAKKHNRVLEISFDQYCLLVVDKVCVYCFGDLPRTGYSLDRVDHIEGYTINNCVPCCRSCNSKKGMLESMGLSLTRVVEILKEVNEIRNKILKEERHEQISSS